MTHHTGCHGNKAPHTNSVPHGWQTGDISNVAVLINGCRKDLVTVHWRAAQSGSSHEDPGRRLGEGGGCKGLSCKHVHTWTSRMSLLCWYKRNTHWYVRAFTHTDTHIRAYTHTPHKLCYKSRFCIAGPAHSLFNERSIRVFLITLVEFDCVEMTMDQKGIPQGTRWGDVPDHRDVPIPVLKQNEK